MFWMLVFGFAVRLFEAALLGYYQEQFWKQLALCLKGFCYDVLFFSKFALLLCPIYLLLHRCSEKAARWTFRILGTLMLLISNAMIMYYISAMMPLDKIFFSYSVKELIYISQSTGAFVWWGYVGLLLIPILFLVVYVRAESGKWKVENAPLSTFHFPLYLWLVLALLGLFVWEVPVWAYRDREGKNTICNKQEFFWRSLIRKEKAFSRFNAKDLEQEQDRILQFQSKFPEDEFVDYRYPFAHLDHSPDVLSAYFDLKPDTMPNLMFIITEGLSREFSGYNSKYPSATPFLDSLADHSLSWLNCMSSSQRTIAVLPSIFGSLPFGERGFMQSPDSPRFRSMVDILKENGYSASFFYGGWTCFDNMCYFLNDMGVDHYLPDYNTYPPEYKNTWGLYDEYLFSESLKEVQLSTLHAPRLDIYLTLTTHDPFDYPDKERYTKRYTEMLVRRHQQHQIEQFQYEQYASYLYFDDCLRKFFKAYREVPGYENTIFVITGDHCFNGKSEELDKYHVPFIIWSPMLKEAHRFPAMIAHRDVTPTFLALLKQTYGIHTPSVVSWLNTGLDTASVFRANTFTPQLKNSREMDNLVYKNRFYDEGMIYSFGYEDDKLTITPVKDDDMVAFMREYKAMDDYVMHNDALLPLDEEKQFLMRDVDSSQSVNYVLLHSYGKLKDTLERKNVFWFDQIYPFMIYNEPLPDSLQSVVVYCDFDIYVPKIEDERKITVSMAIDRADGSRETIKTLVINFDWYDYYDKWDHYSMTQTVNKSQVHFEPGERLMCYFTNGGEHPFLVKDFTMKVIGIYE